MPGPINSPFNRLVADVNSAHQLSSTNVNPITRLMGETVPPNTSQSLAAPHTYGQSLSQDVHQHSNNTGNFPNIFNYLNTGNVPGAIMSGLSQLSTHPLAQAVATHANQQPQPQQPSFWGTYGWPIGLGAAALGAPLLGYWLYNRSRPKRRDEEE